MDRILSYTIFVNHKAKNMQTNPEPIYKKEELPKNGMVQWDTEQEIELFSFSENEVHIYQR